MKELSFYEQQHLQKMLQQQGSIKYIFDDFVRKAGPLLARWSDHSKASVWVGNQSIENSIERLLVDLHSGLLANITDNMIQSWNRGNKKTDDLVSGFIKDLSISDTLRDKMFSRNAEALNAMLNKKDEYGLTVSDRVWNLANGAKDNLEYYLASGLSASRPSALISQDVRQLLNDPDKRFHRVRDKNGNLVPSQPMKNYHPGQGVYRSSYKNALRLSSTQTNKAFRSADYERWKNMDFVLGIEVKRSPSHRGPCPICDALAGRYSKEYKFTGHHPFCICIATPIMMDHEEFAEWLLGNAANDTKVSSMQKNHDDDILSDVIGINRGIPMTFDDANEMRGNPNYKKAVKYRVNCQSSVVANEMRRRGFDVEAYGNTKQDWYMPSVLARKPEIAFIDTNGNHPIPIGIKNKGDLFDSINGELKEHGRYHLRFRFQNDNGHIITAERLNDNSLRIYDPQNGKIIKDFGEYFSKVNNDSFEYYRVDNLRLNPDVVKGVVKPRGMKGDAPRMTMPEITNALEKGWFGGEEK